jgi:hypothetical protein
VIGNGAEAMCSHCPGLTVENILADALVRLVMVADGVSEEEMRIVLENARDALTTREARRFRQRDSRTSHIAEIERYLA